MTETGPSHGHSYRRRAARLLLLVGAVVLALQFLKLLPQEQSLSFALGAERSIRVRRVDVSWRVSDDTDALGGVTLNFPDGAPSIIQHTISVPNGSYILTIRIEQVHPLRQGDAVVSEYLREVTFEGGQTKLFFKDQDR